MVNLPSSHLLKHSSFAGFKPFLLLLLDQAISTW